MVENGKLKMDGGEDRRIFWCFGGGVHIVGLFIWLSENLVDEVFAYALRFVSEIQILIITITLYLF